MEAMVVWRRTVIYFLAALIIGQAVEPLLASDLYVKVVRVLDGDTIDVIDIAQVQYRVRLAGIDAPEKGQAFGQRSKNALSSLVAGRSVKVQWSKKDRYRRIVGKVMYGSTDVSLELVKLGVAWHFKRYQKEQSPSDRELYAAAELAARHSRCGLWSDPNPMPPWEYRKNRSIK